MPSISLEEALRLVSPYLPLVLAFYLVATRCDALVRLAWQPRRQALEAELAAQQRLREETTARDSNRGPGALEWNLSAFVLACCVVVGALAFGELLRIVLAPGTSEGWGVYVGVLIGAGLADVLVWRLRPWEGGFTSRPWCVAAATVFAVLLALAGLAFLHSPSGPRAMALACDYPVRGAWQAAAGGRLAWMNPHMNHPPSQNAATDLVRVDGPTENEPVYAPLAGRIVKAVGDTPGETGPAEGNVIVIETEDGTQIWLAHLQWGSLRVAEGDRVEAGQELALCGASGNAEHPHLHIHAERDGHAVPLLFGPERNFLVRYERFTTP